MRLLEFPIGHHIQWGTFTFKRRGGDYRTRRGEHGKRYARHRWFDDIAYLSYMHDQALPSTLLFQRRCECAVAMRLRIMAFTRLFRRFSETMADSGTVHGARIKYHSSFN